MTISESTSSARDSSVHAGLSADFPMTAGEKKVREVVNNEQLIVVEFVLGADDTGIDAGKYGRADPGEYDRAGDRDDCPDRGPDNCRTDRDGTDRDVLGRHLGPAAESE